MAGVALGVAVLCASLSAGATMDAAVGRAAADEMGHSALRVLALAERGLSKEAVAAVTKTAGVDVAAPALERKTYLAASLSQTPSATLPAPVTVLGIDAVAEPKLHDLPLSGGRLLIATDSESAVVTETLASQERLRIGDSITLNGAGSGPTAYSIVGIVSGDGSVPDAAGRLVIVPLASAQSLFDVTGVTRVDVGVQAGVTADWLIRQLEGTIETEPYLLQKTSDTADSLRAETADFRGTLLLVAAVVLFAGSFLIFNTLSMTVTEQSREVGLLRAAGATRSQVVGLVLLQALALGGVGSIVGVVVGTGLSSLTLSWVNATGPIALDAPDISLGSVLLALVIGILVTLAASLEPAWRAGRIPPVEALRRGPRGAVAGAARLRWLVLVFAVLAVAALAVWPGGSSGGAGSTPGSGGPTLQFGMLGPLVVYGLMLAAVLIVPRVLGPLLRLAGVPFRIFRNEERLARSSLARDTSRTTLTAGALVMGLAMVVALGTAAQNIRQIGASWLTETIPGSELLTSIHPISPADPGIDEIAALPGVKSVSPIGLLGVPLAGVRQEAAAISGRDFAADGRLVFVEGGGDAATAFAALDTGGAVIVPASLANESSIRLGDTLSFATGETPTLLRVVGIVAHSVPGDSQETVLIGWSDALGPFGASGADFFAVRYQPGQESSARAAVDAMASQYALQSADLGRVRGTVGDALDRVFRLLDALALIAVLVAGLGMVNTLSMSVLERVREIGVLRAIGMSSRRVWSMVVIEAGILGLAGSLIGAAVGLLVGGLLVAWSSGGFGLAFDPPWASIALAVLFGVLISVTASIYPAGVASRQSIVRALQHE
ncbi:MAG: FtsX-like permease family protein [Candidatus Limnocylindrales bacterium]|jgi:putative ABC transport system permease protein